MPDSWQFLLLFSSNAVGWATACAFLLRSRQWEMRYGALKRAADKPTPHQKAAETRRRKRVDEMRAHRIAMEADINGRKILAGVHVPADAPVAAFTSSPLTLDDIAGNSPWVPNLEREWGVIEQRHPAAEITLSCPVKTQP